MDKNIIFMGTPEFAVPVLEKVHKELGVKAVVTVPDRPKGRGRKLMPSAVKLSALEFDIPVLQPEKLKDEAFINVLGSFNPDIILVVAFRILPPSVFNLASIGTFNIHASLLPKFRGAAPINWAIINGEEVTGLTTFLIDEKVDTGNLLLQEKFNIPSDFTAGDLHDFMMPRAAEIGLNTCKLLLSGNFNPQRQDHSLASPAPKLFPDQSFIDWSKPAVIVKNFIHGFSPIPGARTRWNKKIFKIYRVKLYDEITLTAGEFVIKDGKFLVGCLDNALEIIELQQEGKKMVNVSSFINGYRGELQGFFA